MDLVDDPIISGYKELEDAVNEMKEWKAELNMEVMVFNRKNLKYCNALVLFGSDLKYFL